MTMASIETKVNLAKNTRIFGLFLTKKEVELLLPGINSQLLDARFREALNRVGNRERHRRAMKDLKMLQNIKTLAESL